MKLVAPSTNTSLQVQPTTSVVPSISPVNTAQRSIGLFVQGTKELVDEIRWVIHMTLKDASDREIVHDTKVLKLMAPNDLKNFGMSAEKLSYTKKAVADWLWELWCLTTSKTVFTP